MLNPIPDRGPLRVLFLTTSMPVGGAETLLVDLVRKMDKERFRPELACTKDLGLLGEALAGEIPTHCNLLTNKTDVRVLTRLTKIMRSRRVDAVVTVGAGDKMFWGRLAAHFANIPVVCSALHSTGWPDSVGRLNRWLTPITDAFIAVAGAHGEHLVNYERFPKKKIHVIPNGIDVERFRLDTTARQRLRNEFKCSSETRVFGIVAALRPEKNHAAFLRAAEIVRRNRNDVQFWIVGDGEERSALELLQQKLGISNCVRFLGERGDIPLILSALDCFVLTSDNEANPVSILEAMSVGLPIVATHVGSVAESVLHGETGFLVPPRDIEAIARSLNEICQDVNKARLMGKKGRTHVVANGSVQHMVNGYESLIERIYSQKFPPRITEPQTSCAVFTDSGDNVPQAINTGH